MTATDIHDNKKAIEIIEIVISENFLEIEQEEKQKNRSLILAMTIPLDISMMVPNYWVAKLSKKEAGIGVAVLIRQCRHQNAINSGRAIKTLPYTLTSLG